MHIDLHRLSPGQGDSILDDAHLIGQPGLAVVGELLLVIVLSWLTFLTPWQLLGWLWLVRVMSFGLGRGRGAGYAASYLFRHQALTNLPSRMQDETLLLG